MTPSFVRLLTSRPSPHALAGAASSTLRRERPTPEPGTVAYAAGAWPADAEAVEVRADGAVKSLEIVTA